MTLPTRPPGLAFLFPDRPWDVEANCKGIPVESMYPRVSDTASVEAARAVCRGDAITPECPVRQQCLEWAIINREDYGVWGGYTEQERRRISRYRRRAGNALSA